VLFHKYTPHNSFEKNIYPFLRLEITSPGNQHCASCIGTLSFPIRAALYEEFFFSWGSRHHCPTEVGAYAPKVPDQTAPMVAGRCADGDWLAGWVQVHPGGGVAEGHGNSGGRERQHEGPAHRDSQGDRREDRRYAQRRRLLQRRQGEVGT